MLSGLSVQLSSNPDDGSVLHTLTSATFHAAMLQPTQTFSMALKSSSETIPSNISPVKSTTTEISVLIKITDSVIPSTTLPHPTQPKTASISKGFTINTPMLDTIPFLTPQSKQSTPLQSVVMETTNHVPFVSGSYRTPIFTSTLTVAMITATPSFMEATAWSSMFSFNVLSKLSTSTFSIRREHSSIVSQIGYYTFSFESLRYPLSSLFKSDAASSSLPRFLGKAFLYVLIFLKKLFIISEVCTKRTLGMERESYRGYQCIKIY